MERVSDCASPNLYDRFACATRSMCFVSCTGGQGPLWMVAVGARRDQSSCSRTWRNRRIGIWFRRCVKTNGSGGWHMAEIEAVRLTDRVKIGLVRMIVDDGLKPGDKLPPADRLSEHFAVSRTVVREAVASLKAEGRLRSLRGSGVYVSEPPKTTGSSMFMQAPQDIGEVLDFIEFRMSVEIEAAGLAAERRTETSLLRMEQAMSQFARRLGDNTLATDADRNFHRAIADATNNARFRLFVTRWASGSSRAGSRRELQR
ncbi:MAG: FadR family transcriptional regulator [Blastochloris sp.]|nr:FadR family transcriptional regulator [Blastochloris sp.]